MRVFDQSIITEEGEVCVAARVEVETARNELPRSLWFRFPAEYAGYVTDRYDGFAAALLPLAMHLGEDLHVEGALSPRLLHGMREYLQIQARWMPTSFTPVAIRCEALSEADRAPGVAAVGSSFSGGVDSFHTLWRRLPENEPMKPFQVTHCIMINGFDADTDLEDKGHFADIRKTIDPVMEELGLRFVVCRSNYMRFSDANILKQTFAAMVTVPALVLGRLFSCFFIPSSYRFDDFIRDGSHLMFDHLIATESMLTVHDSACLDRVERTAVVADWPATYSSLRVCFNETGYQEETGAIINCGRCEKCVRTMKTLELLGRLDRFKTFARPAGHFAVWKSYFGTPGPRTHAFEVMKLAWKKRRYTVVLDYCVAMFLSVAFRWPREWLQKVHLHLEEHSAPYAVWVRRRFPRLRRRAYWIRSKATHARPPGPTRESGPGER